MPLSLTNEDLLNAARKYGIPLISVFSKSDPPRRLISGGYIVNMQNSHDGNGNRQPGTHWVAFFLTPRYAFYYDPFGVEPPTEIHNLLTRYSPKGYDINLTQVQSLDSGICGYYCLHFIWYMGCMGLGRESSQKRFKKFVDLWNDKNPHKNREILEKLIADIKPQK